MPKNVTIHDVARHAKVSIKTVSRVINNSMDVADETRSAVMASVRALDYHPHVGAQNLAGKRSRTIAVTIPLSPQHVFSRPFFSQVLYGISEVLEAHDYGLLLHTRPNAGFLEPLKNRQADGLIVMSVPVRDPRILELQRARVPFVLTCRVDTPNSDLDRSLSWVDADHVAGAETAVTHLVNLGHRDIALIEGPENLMVSRLRAEGFWRGVQRLGQGPNSFRHLKGDFSIEHGRALGLQLLVGSDRPTAVMCVEDSLAVGMLQAARSLGIRVPDDLSVIGYDDATLSAHVDPPLTTVRQQAERKGQLAATAVLRLLEGGPKRLPEQHLLTTELVVRNSTAPPSSGAANGEPRRVLSGQTTANNQETHPRRM